MTVTQSSYVSSSLTNATTTVSASKHASHSCINNNGAGANDQVT